MKRLIVVFVLVAGCKAKLGQHCDKQSDCAGDLVCDCEDETEFACRDDGGARCMTLTQANAICAKDDVCRMHGECLARPRAQLPPDQISPGCYATQAICTSSDVCRRFGQCKEEKGECVPANDDDCKRSTLCREVGDCSKVGNYCFPKSDAECAASTRCKTEGKCKLGAHDDCVQ